jgi:hypothetical protein
MAGWLANVRRCCEDESGQASAEYILMLAVGIAMAITLVRKFIRPVLARLADAFSAQLAELFSKDNLHTLKFGR